MPHFNPMSLLIPDPLAAVAVNTLGGDNNAPSQSGFGPSTQGTVATSVGPQRPAQAAPQPQPEPDRSALARPQGRPTTPKPKAGGTTAGSASTLGSATSPLVSGSPSPTQVPSSGLNIEEQMKRAVAGRGGMGVGVSPLPGF